MAARNPYLVTKALNSYLKGSVLIAISGHLVTTSDAVVVSWLIGSKAFTAVNIVIPILSVFSALMIMISIGASVSVSKALGLRASEKVNLSFSSSLTGAVVLGAAVAVVTYKFSSDIVKELVKQDGAIFRYALEYLKIFCYAVPALIVAGVLSNIVRADGNTRLVTIAVAIGIVVNVGLDIVFIRFLNMGIGGAAWATLINYLLVVLICLMHFFSSDNTVKWSWNVGKYFLRFIKNCKLGFSTSLNTLLSGVSLFVINSMMLPYQGNEGLYCWAVCYQIFLILQMLLSGIDSS
ncbi:MAG: polysaccharide biosynthesis C-terminal domain-containing protein, partial [Muribaculaceae bacterium]|nr:polysaccharide biosynthesis C-terminal domain-containing protein [Muribaculaceae bacterium]